MNNYKSGSNICGNNRWNTVSFTADDYVERWRQLSKLWHWQQWCQCCCHRDWWHLKWQSIMLMTMTTQVLTGRTVGTVRKGCALGYYRLNRIINELKVFNDSTNIFSWVGFVFSFGHELGHGIGLAHDRSYIALSSKNRIFVRHTSWRWCWWW